MTDWGHSVKLEVHNELDKNKFHLIEFHGAIIAVALAICILAGCFCCLSKKRLP